MMSAKYSHLVHGSLTRYEKLGVAHAPGMPGTFSPSPRVSDPGMHHGMCVTHVPRCMPGSPTGGFLWNGENGENVPGIPGACATPFQRKPPVGDPGMHRGTCVTHMPWCMPGSLTRGDGENVPGIPGACATRNFPYLVRGPWASGLISNS